MASQLFTYPFPYGVDNTQRAQIVRGVLALYGASVTTGEPMNWSNNITGIPYNLVNFAGNGVNGNGNALVTAISNNGTTVTATAANNFAVGQSVTFQNCTTTIGAELNGLTFTIATCSSSQFTFASALTGSGSGETGQVVSIKGNTRVLAGMGPLLSATVSNLAASVASGGVPAYITVTATNTFLPGASVTFANLTTALGLLMNGVSFTVVKSTGSAFVVYSTLTGSAGADTGTAVGQNVPQPVDVSFKSDLASGYIYEYKKTTGCLFAFSGTSGTLAGTISTPTLTMNSYTPAGTNNSATPPIFTGTAATLTGTISTPTLSGASVSAGPLAALTAAAYPAGVLGDVITYQATFIKQV